VTPPAIVAPPVRWRHDATGAPDVAAAAALLARLGFLASSDLPDRPGPAWLAVALRERPTFRHFDPERIDYWATRDGQGMRRTLTRASPMPCEDDVSWGIIRVTDRLHATNEFLTFGGTLEARLVDGDGIVVVVSPAPILRRGGHSQVVEPGADAIGAWFGRLLLAVDIVPAFESRLARAGSIGRYASFLADLHERYDASPLLRDQEPTLCALLRGEERRVRRDHPDDWQMGMDLRVARNVTDRGTVGR
jgi:hypothetical protein